MSVPGHRTRPVHAARTGRVDRRGHRHRQRVRGHRRPHPAAASRLGADDESRVRHLQLVCARRLRGRSGDRRCVHRRHERLDRVRHHRRGQRASPSPLCGVPADRRRPGRSTPSTRRASTSCGSCRSWRHCRCRRSNDSCARRSVRSYVAGDVLIVQGMIEHEFFVLLDGFDRGHRRRYDGPGEIGTGLRRRDRTVTRCPHGRPAWLPPAGAVRSSSAATPSWKRSR